MPIQEEDIKLQHIGGNSFCIEKLQPGDYTIYFKDTKGNPVAKLEFKEIVIETKKDDVFSEKTWQDKNTYPERIRACFLKFKELCHPINAIKISPR